VTLAIGRVQQTGAVVLIVAQLAGFDGKPKGIPENN